MKVCSVCHRCFEDSVVSCSEENHDFLNQARAGSCEIIANYRLEFLHESSAASETYRAVNTILKKPYLIKIVAPDLFDENRKKRFLSEAQALSAIIHPNVVRTFESGTLADGSLYVVTEFFTAQTLRECLENVGAPSEVTALTITRQAAEGLEAIHAASVFHRNVRPENIILTADAENRFLVKLQNIDFGGIRQKQVNSNAELYLSDFRYFSPEQCAAAEADAQTDVYSLGIVLYEALAGHVPFDAPYADALIKKQTGETPPEVKIKSFDIRMLLTHTLSDALQKQSRTRLKSANAFARRIRHIEQLATHSPTPPPVMSYPAAMNKAAVGFTPPAVKAEKAEAPAKFENQMIVEDLKPVESRAGFEENPVAFEIQTQAEDSSLIESGAVAENPVAVESEIAAEILPAVENPAVIENPLTLENRSVNETPAVIENPPAAEEKPAALESETVIEDSVPIEAQPVIEDLVPVEALPVVEDSVLVEARAIVEDLPPVEAQTAIENPVVFEDAVIEDLPAVEAQGEAESIIPIETGTVADEAILFENPAVAEDSAVVEAQPAEPVSVETEPEFQDLPLVEVEAAFASSEAPAPVSADLTTNKLPPIESVIKKTLPENFVITEITPIFSLRSKTADIHKTSEPVLVQWEQPDDVPTITQALSSEKKETADAAFADESIFIEDDVIDAGDADSPPDGEDDEIHLDYAAERPVFSYDDSGTSWNFTEKQKRFLGAGIAAFLVFAVGAMLLSRQFQSARSGQQTTAQSAPVEKPAPKPAESEKVAETEKPATVKAEELTADNPVSDADNRAIPELPDYQPRETEGKNVVLPAPKRSSSSSSSDKTVVKTAVEKTAVESRDMRTPTKPVSTETSSKKAETKSPPEKKAAVKNQSSTPTKTDIFTRPRIVKNPQF